MIATTNQLVNCIIYEYLLKKILKEYRIREDREFFNVEIDLIKEIFETFNYINSILDTDEKLNWYISNYHPEYFNKKKYIKINTSSNEKTKNKKRKFLYVDTSNL